MSYRKFIPKHIYVEAQALNYKTTKQILARLSNVEHSIIENSTEITTVKKGQCLILAKQKGDFYKKCPGTHNYICCGYKTLNLVNNCDIDCSYCILQGYMNTNHIYVYVNIEELLSELDALFNKFPDHIFRIGTGEFADSLSTDHITQYSKILVEYFKDKQNAILELKTKSTQIENFINTPHGGRTVIAWSLNTPEMIASEEPLSPTLKQRLQAAQKCQQAGFRIGFHFDPMIYYNNWEQDYKMVVDEIFKYIDPQSIIWISLGALRYPAHFDRIIRENHPESDIVLGELIAGLDNKLRYFKPIRIEMFKKMYQWIKSYGENVFVYLCMESSEVWEKSFGWTPSNSGRLAKMMNALII